VAAAQAGVGDEDYVVGLKFGDQVYAYPYAALYADPVVSQLERGKRLLLIWNAFANKATAYQVDQDVPGRDLEIVSMPANAVVVYNARLGEFINGITGRKPNGEKVTGVLSPVDTTKTTWKSWRDAHPGTKVMVPSGRYAVEGLPRRAVLPYYKVPAAVAGELPAETRVVAVGRESSVAIPADRVKESPTQLTVDGVPVVLFRDPQAGVVRAFDRRVDDNVVADFQLNTDARRKNVALVDRVTNTGWSWGGSAVDGAAKWKGRKLEAVPVEEDLYYGVAKYWHPSMTVTP
jgi:hypothetical protein